MIRIQFLPRTVRAVAMFGTLLFCIGLFCLKARTQAVTATSTGSTVNFTVYDYNRSSDWPIKITKLILGDSEIPLNTPVHVTGHWLRTLSLIAQNVSSKNIVYAVALYEYPETGKGTPDNPLYITTSGFGQIPEAALLRPNGSRMDRPLHEPPVALVPPGGMMTFPAITEIGGEDRQADAYQRAGGHITQVTVVFQMIFFDDNSRWSAETYFVPSTTAPGRWEKASPEQFLHK